MGPKEVPEESVPERDRPGVISTNVALVAMVCAQSTEVIQPWEFSEMVEEGIREAAAMAEVPCEVVRPLPLGPEVAA